MRISILSSLIVGPLVLGCGSPGPAQSPKEASDGEMEAFDPSVESDQQPFSAVNAMRGPGLHINGLRFTSEDGSFQAMVSAYSGDTSIVFRMMKTETTPSAWLDACPRSAEDPNLPALKVNLKGVGDISNNAMVEGDAWSVSISAEQYAKMSTLQFHICGTDYLLEDKYKERLALHAQAGTKEVIATNQKKRTTYQKACDQEDDNACASLAAMMRRGEGGDQNFEDALAIYKNLCDAGSDGACLGASRVLTESPTTDLTEEAKDRYKEAASFASRACDLARTTAGLSCFQAARLYASGFGVPADAKRVQKYVEASCAKRYRHSCKLGDAILSCAKGQATACAEMAAATGASTEYKEPGQEALWNRAACNNGHNASCSN